MAPLVSRLARDAKLAYFFARLDPGQAILDVGSGDGWVKSWAQAHGYHRVVSLDRRPPADVVGDVTAWATLGLAAHSFDAITAFEVIEHGDLAGALHSLLEPGGLLMATTPVPAMDWACRLGEAAGLLQRRTSPHTHLTDLRRLPGFEVVEHRVKGLVSQWGILRAR